MAEGVMSGGKREICMRRYAIRLLTLALCAAVVAAVPVIGASPSEAGSRHVRKPHRPARLGWNDSVAPVQRAAPQQWNGPGEVCPGNARAIDCKIWPPPIYDDPDRKQSGTDGS